MPRGRQRMDLHVEALFTHDADGSLVRVNEPDGAPAPRFFRGRTGDGLVRRHRRDVADAAASAARYAAILARSAPVRHTGAGPAAPPPIRARRWPRARTSVSRVAQVARESYDDTGNQTGAPVMSARTARAPRPGAPRRGAGHDDAAPAGRRTPEQTRERAAVLEPLLRRMHEALDALAGTAPLEVIRTASAAQTGAGSIAALVSQLPEANPALAGADPEAAAVARAAAAKQRLMEAVPTLTTADVAARLRVTEAAVRKARKEGRLLAVEFDGQQRYPAFQFSPAGIRPAVREVLAALTAVPITSDWVRLDFLTAPNAAEDDGRSVAELLRDGDLAPALEAVRSYGETGA